MGNIFDIISYHNGPMPSLGNAPVLYLHANVKFLTARLIIRSNMLLLLSFVEVVSILSGVVVVLSSL